MKRVKQQRKRPVNSEGGIDIDSKPIRFNSIFIIFSIEINQLGNLFLFTAALPFPSQNVSTQGILMLLLRILRILFGDQYDQVVYITH